MAKTTTKPDILAAIDQARQQVAVLLAGFMIDGTATTTTKPDILANGAELLGKMQITVRSSGATGWIILAKRDHPYEPFVTWLSIDGHHCESGSYFENREQAMESFNKRVAKHN